MDKLRVLDTNLGLGPNSLIGSKISKSRQHDIDTLTIQNKEKTAKLQALQSYKDLDKWLQEHGAHYPAVEFPVAFGKHGELLGLAAKKDIPPQKAFLFIPQKLIINEIVCRQDPVCGPVYEKHPDIFRDHFDNEYLLMIVFVMHNILLGEKSFWHVYWKTVCLSDLPMRWADEEVAEVQDAFLQREITTFKEEYVKEFELIFDTFRENKYEDVLPGIAAPDAEKTKEEMEKLFYQCFNIIVTRCFGWGLPKTSLIPFADLINHHNVDSTYEFICEELHAPLRHVNDYSDHYSIDIKEFVEDNRKELQLDNPDIRDMEDASYYTKSKMMFDISDFYLDQA